MSELGFYVPPTTRSFGDLGLNLSRKTREAGDRSCAENAFLLTSNKRRILSILSRFADFFGRLRKELKSVVL